MFFDGMNGGIKDRSGLNAGSVLSNIYAGSFMVGVARLELATFTMST